MKQAARVLNTDLTAKSNSKGEIRFKFSDGGYYTIEVLLPNGEIRVFKDVEVKRGKTTTVEVLI